MGVLWYITDLLTTAATNGRFSIIQALSFLKKVCTGNTAMILPIMILLLPKKESLI